MNEPILITALGKPEPAGSKRAFPFKRKNGQMGVAVSDANPNAKSWQHCVASAAREVYQGDLLRGPLTLKVFFFLPRCKGHFGSGKNAGKLKAGAPLFPDKKPDATKLLRGVEDSLTGVVWLDDAQIVKQVVEKHYGEPARAEIVVMSAE